MLPPQTKASGPAAIFELPKSLEDLGAGCSVDGLKSVQLTCFPDFFDHPWPSDVRKDESGKVRTKGWPNPSALPNIRDYIGVADRLTDGFSPQAAGFLRFTASLDPKTLPGDPNAATAATSSVQLVDVDDASPEKGQRRRIDVLFRAPEGVYWAPNTLSFLPTFGYPLRPHTRYAIVVTTAVRTTDGRDLQRPPALDAVLGLGPEVAGSAAVQKAWAPAIAALDAAGLKKESIAHLSVFTTNDPTEELFRIRDHIKASFPKPTVKAPVVAKDDNTDYDVYESSYGPSPDYQKGSIPFAKLGDGGDFAFDGSGTPVVQREFDLRFTVTVPKAAKCPMPAAGYPITLYAHGTGGDYRSYIGDGTARALAQQCVASMGVDQIFHGTRPGAPTGPDADTQIQLLFFNFDNPIAARANARQSALDEVQRARLFTETQWSISAADSRTKAEIKFDPTKVMFFGHSQGGLNGPLYLAADDSARGGVLSGSGSVISITLLEKTKPQPSVAAAVRSVFLGLKQDSYEELSSFHPAIALAQSIVDPVDPIHYVGHLIRSPRAGFAPKSIYQTEGVNPDFTGDNYTPPHAIEVQAVATGLPLMNPVIHPVKEMAYTDGFGPLTIPADGLSGNLAGGKATGVLAQWPAAQAKDGHFVVFDIAAAKLQAATFCKNLAADPKGRVSAPLPRRARVQTRDERALGLEDRLGVEAKALSWRALRRPRERPPQRQRRRALDRAAEAVEQVASVREQRDGLAQRGIARDALGVLFRKRSSLGQREGVQRPELQLVRALLVGGTELLRAQARNVHEPAAQRTEAVRVGRVQAPARALDQVERAVDVAGEEAREVRQVLAGGTGVRGEIGVVPLDPGERGLLEARVRVHGVEPQEAAVDRRGGPAEQRVAAPLDPDGSVDGDGVEHGVSVPPSAGRGHFGRRAETCAKIAAADCR